MGSKLKLENDVFLNVALDALITTLYNLDNFGATYNGIPVLVDEQPIITILNSTLSFGNFIIKVDGNTDGLKVMYSSDLKSKFKEVSSVAKLGDNQFLIPASAPELQGPQGFFLLKINP
jgi:hypothetical protein